MNPSSQNPQKPPRLACLDGPADPRTDTPTRLRPVVRLLPDGVRQDRPDHDHRQAGLRHDRAGTRPGPHRPGRVPPGDAAGSVGGRPRRPCRPAQDVRPCPDGRGHSICAAVLVRLDRPDFGAPDLRTGVPLRHLSGVQHTLGPGPADRHVAPGAGASCRCPRARRVPGGHDRRPGRLRVPVRRSPT